MRRVKEVAKLTGVSVRTLHHYDDIGLLCPTRSQAGYREYVEEDLERLQQILIGRALGLPLEKIRVSLDDPNFDRKRSLREQRTKLQKQRRSLDVMIRAVDAALEGDSMETQFKEFDHEVYQEEVQANWGEEDAYKESARRMKSYGDDDLKRMKAELKAINANFIDCLHSSAENDDHAVQTRAADVAEDYRQHIEQWFYPCSTAFLVEVSRLYTEDDRFKANYERQAPGLAAFVQRSILANHEREEKGKD